MDILPYRTDQLFLEILATLVREIMIWQSLSGLFYLHKEGWLVAQAMARQVFMLDLCFIIVLDYGLKITQIRITCSEFL